MGTYVWWRGKGKGAARAETEARAGATGSDLVILPSNPPCSSLRPLPSSIQPSTLNYRPPLNPFVRAFPVEDSRPSLSSLHPRDFRLAFVLLGWNVLSLSVSVHSTRKDVDLYPPRFPETIEVSLESLKSWILKRGETVVPPLRLSSEGVKEGTIDVLSDRSSRTLSLFIVPGACPGTRDKGNGQKVRIMALRENT